MVTQDDLNGLLDEICELRQKQKAFSSDAVLSEVGEFCKQFREFIIVMDYAIKFNHIQDVSVKFIYEGLKEKFAILDNSH